MLGSGFDILLIPFSPLSLGTQLAEFIQLRREAGARFHYALTRGRTSFSGARRLRRPISSPSVRGDAALDV